MKPDSIPWDLVIFDCDGVLVDSEALGTQVMIEMAVELGARLSAAACVDRFRGVRMAVCMRSIEAHLERPLPADFEHVFRLRCAEVFERRLRPVDGVASALDALERLGVGTCVASSSPVSKIVHMLELTGILNRFRGRIFSAYEIGCWKPDPGLFLHAASRLGARHCAVVEDSVVGVQAGVRAGMTVFGYADEPYADLLREEGAITFDEMASLPDLLQTVHPCALHAARSSRSTLSYRPQSAIQVVL